MEIFRVSVLGVDGETGRRSQGLSMGAALRGALEI